MPKFNITRRYAHSSDEIFAVAADVAAYNKFVPLVREVKVSGKQKHANGSETFNAALSIQYPRLNISETADCKMTVDRKSRTIQFRRLALIATVASDLTRESWFKLTRQIMVIT